MKKAVSIIIYKYFTCFLLLPLILLSSWALYTEYHEYSRFKTIVRNKARIYSLFYAETLHVRMYAAFSNLRSISKGFEGHNINPSMPGPKDLKELWYLISTDSKNFYSIDTYTPSGNRILWSTRKQSHIPIVRIAKITTLQNYNPKYILGDDVYSKRVGANVLTMFYKVDKNNSQNTKYLVGGAYILDKLLRCKQNRMIGSAPFTFTVIDAREGSIFGKLKNGRISFPETPAFYYRNKNKLTNQIYQRPLSFLYKNKNNNSVTIKVQNFPIEIMASWPNSLIWHYYIKSLLPRLFFYILSFFALLASLLVIKKLIKKIQDGSDKFQVMSIKDSLTGIYNRRYLMEKIKDEVNRGNRTGIAFSVIMTDIDFFKKVNDKFGHSVGDSVLQTFAKIISERLRITDCFARYGGEEFAIILPHTSLENAKIIAEDLRKAIEKTDMENLVRITASFGIAAFRPGTDTVDSIINRADEKLYEAKSSGRNMVIC